AQPASHGCVRLSNVDEAWLFARAHVGTRVIIYDTTGKSPSVMELPKHAVGGA
ncbi:MAG: L,D-transpeptidase, partial [Acidimicrobiales bacterium]